MEQTSSPKFTTDAFIPLPVDDINRTSLYSSKHRYLNNTSQLPSSSRQNQVHFSDSCIVPWKKTAYSCGVIGLHEEINDFYETMRPTEEETEIRLRVVEHITKVVHSLWPQAQVEVFGSFRTGLFLPSSDIDMVVIGEWRNLPLSTLSQALQKNGISEDDIKVIATATVPIVRLTHTLSNVKVDICFNSTNGVESAKMVKKLIKQYPTLPKLVLVLKQFLVQRGLNEVYNGGMSSYCLTLLIVSLLQGYHKPKTLPSSNLGTLLLEFFEHYGVNFNYEKVSIHFQNNKTGGMYQPKYNRSEGLLSVEDPLVKGHDVAKGTFLIHSLKQAFENAFLVLHKAITDSAAEKRPLNSYLSLIVHVEGKLLEDRHWMHQNYSTILMRLSSSSPNYEQGEKQNIKLQTTKKKKRMG